MPQGDAHQAMRVFVLQNNRERIAVHAISLLFAYGAPSFSPCSVTNTIKAQ
jgi:hypothetical protein